MKVTVTLVLDVKYDDIVSLEHGTGILRLADIAFDAINEKYAVVLKDCDVEC